MKSKRVALLFIVLSVISCYCITSIYRIHGVNNGEQLISLAAMPESLVKASSLEFQGVTSDYLMLKILTYLGQKIIDDQKLNTEEWQTVYLALKQVINLDPRFLDPYILAQMTLPYDAGMVEETNILLEKAAHIFQDDYRPYFFLWYNYFYFLNDPTSAAEYLEKSSAKPGAPLYFTTLAARMNLYAGKIYAAVIFLEQTLSETTDPALRKFLSTRIEALKKIGFLELKVKEYKKRYKRMPLKLQELIDNGIITEIPKDPYGGEFYIMDGGRVYTTSELVNPKNNK